jgi:peptidoglycan/xylan/chitin deacetylase (PgdA/CDA1 family)
MTFDDGPSAENTPRLLDMLKQRGIKATFFMVGENAAAYPQIVKRILAEGHEVGNHSWSHPLFSKMSEEAVRDQLKRTQDAIVAGCGTAPKVMRPPYGGFTERQRRWCYGEFGYKCILWDVDPLDWKYRNSARVESEILKHTVSGSIVLAHDIHKSTVDAMPATLDALAAKGFKFVTVSQLIAMDKPASAKPKAEPKAYGPGAETGSGTKAEAPAPKSATATPLTPTARPATPAPAAQ